MPNFTGSGSDEQKLCQSWIRITFDKIIIIITIIYSRKHHPLFFYNIGHSFFFKQQTVKIIFYVNVHVQTKDNFDKENRHLDKSVLFFQISNDDHHSINNPFTAFNGISSSFSIHNNNTTHLNDDIFRITYTTWHSIGSFIILDYIFIKHICFTTMVFPDIFHI